MKLKKQQQSLGTGENFSPIERSCVPTSPTTVEATKVDRKRRKKRSKNRKKRRKDRNSSSSSSSLPAATNGLSYWMELDVINGEASKRHRDQQRCQSFILPDLSKSINAVSTIDGTITENSETQEPTTNCTATCLGNHYAGKCKHAFDSFNDSLNDFVVPMPSLGRSKSKGGRVTTTMRAKILCNLRKFLRKSFRLPKKNRGHEERWSRLSFTSTLQWGSNLS